MDLHTRGGGCFDSGDAAGDVAGAIPDLQGESLAAEIEGEIAGGEREKIFTGFEERGFTGILEESLNLRAGLLGAAAGGP